MRMEKAKFDINIDGRDFFVGDIHGMFDDFMEALARVDFDFDNDRMFSVGDLIDRGPKNVECLNLLNKPWFHACRGNHEDMMLGGQPEHIWFMNGGDWWNEVDDPERAILKRWVIEKTFQTMTVDTVFGRIGVIHADTNHVWANNDWTTEELNLWGRRRIHQEDRVPVYGVEAVVCGHTPVKDVVVLGNVVYIDTGAVFKQMKGKLTILDAEDVFELVANEEKEWNTQQST